MQDFASGYTFGQLLYSFNLQPDFEHFDPKRTPDAMINNFTRLQVGHTVLPYALVVLQHVCKLIHPATRTIQHCC